MQTGDLSHPRSYAEKQMYSVFALDLCQLTHCTGLLHLPSEHIHNVASQLAEQQLLQHKILPPEGLAANLPSIFSLQTWLVSHARLWQQVYPDIPQFRHYKQRNDFWGSGDDGQHEAELT